MEIDALPLDRGAMVEMRELQSSSGSTSRLRQITASSAQSLSPRSSHQLLFFDDLEYGGPDSPLASPKLPPATDPQQLTPMAMRRVQSYQVGTSRDLDGFKKMMKKNKHSGYGTTSEARALLREESIKYRQAREEAEAAMAAAHKQGALAERIQQKILDVMVNLTSGVIAFLLSSTLAVSCASVIVGHGTPLADYIAHFIDMNFLGTAVLSIVLAWQSRAPWTLGAIDVFVVPVMGTMAKKITKHLDGDMEQVVPTTVVMVALVSVCLGLVFLIMGLLRVTSIANYMPYPVIAGFLSGIGAELMRNGIHMAAEEAFSMLFFTWEQQFLIWPAVLFAAMARLAQHLRVPVAIAFPCLLVASLSGFHFLSRTVLGYKMHELEDAGWLFPWPADVVRATPMWYPWAKIDLTKVSWYVLGDQCFSYLVTLVILGALKYSVSTTSLSTLFGREISPDNEMRVIGVANIVSGLLGCCGGCHYLSAMGIMKQFEAHEKVPALVCAVLLLLMWVQGIRLLQYVPKFVFGGLILSVGLHFLEAYFVAPFRFLKQFEKGIVVLITVSFLVVGMLEAVGLGVIISMIDLIYRIHEVGCVHHETTGQLTRSSVDRTPEQLAYLETHGSAVFVLRLQGYLFFGTSVNVLERIETRMRSLDASKLQFLIIDFGLVPNFDATALLNFRKATHFAHVFGFEIYFCGLKKPIEEALKHNDAAVAAATSSGPHRVHYLAGNIDLALEECENRLLPVEIRSELPGPADDWKHMSQLALWEHFIGLQENRASQYLLEDDHAKNNTRLKKLLPLAAYLDKQVVAKGDLLTSRGVLTDTYFICYGYINIMIDTEFTNGSIPGLNDGSSSSGIASPSPHSGFSTRLRRASRLASTESKWTPFSTAKERLRKIGPGSIITPDTVGEITADFYQYIATSDCVLLRLSPQALENVETRAPHTAVAVMKVINDQVATRFLYANKRVTQLSSLLYK